MSVCTGCSFDYLWKDEVTTCPKECEGCVYIDGKPSKYKPMQKTNADRIRAMTDEELAKWMSGGATMSDSSCYYCKNNKLPYCDGTDCIDKSDADIIVNWLQQPCEGE